MKRKLIKITNNIYIILIKFNYIILLNTSLDALIIPLFNIILKIKSETL